APLSPANAPPEFILPGCSVPPGNPFAGRNEEVRRSGQAGPIGIFNAAFDGVGANCDWNPRRSVSGVIVSHSSVGADRCPQNEKRPLSRPLALRVTWTWRVC